MGNINNLEIAIGERIKSLRKKREITQEQLADYLNISFQSVSKWECGDAYPDITMLPKIAMFFGVTTDELLCVDKAKEQEEINEYLQRKGEALAKGHTIEAVEIMREINAKYPGNYNVMYDLAYALHTDAYSPHALEYQQNSYKEIISIGQKILAECKDNIIRHGMVEVMCYSYKRIGEKEKAKKLIDENLSYLWVSRENMLNNVLEGEELTKHRQQTLRTLTELLSWEMYWISKDFAPENRLAVLENIIKIYSLVFSDGNYGYYHVKIPTFHGDAADIYLDSGNNAKALEHLKGAAGHAVAFDNLALKNIIKNFKGNQSYNLLKKLGGEKFNPIRETPEFIEICENLEKHARED